MSVTSVRLQDHLLSRLQRFLQKSNRSRNAVVNIALEEYLENQEQEERRWEETLVALDSVHTGKVVAGEQVHTWIKSWGSANELSPPKKSEE